MEIISNLIDLKLSQKNEDVFSHNLYLLHQYQVKNNREIKASFKNRSSVSGGGKKPYKQKGTGSARRGTNRSPLRRGGAVAFGPNPRFVRKFLNKKFFSSVYRELFTNFQAKIFKLLILDKDKISSLKEKKHDFQNSLFIFSDKSLIESFPFKNLKHCKFNSVNKILVTDFLIAKNIYFLDDSFDICQKRYLI